MSGSPALFDELEVRVEKLVAGGDGLARASGLPLFVPRSAPGDRLRVRVIERRRDYGRAEILEILEPGAGRRAAPCPHFARCGGCDLQHLDEAHQLRYKVAAARETLERLGGLAWPRRVEVVAGEPWSYRLRARFHLEATAEGAAAGYLERGSWKLVPVERCPVLAPELDELLASLPSRLGGTPPRKLDVASGDGGQVTVSPPLPGLGRGAVRRRVGGYDYAFDARCFFQGHGPLVERLVAAVVGEAKGELACDLFCGVGLFTLPLAARYRRVLGVEGDRIAVRYARRNARDAGAGGVEIAARAVESWIAELPRSVDRVVADPPRLGLPRAVRATLLERRPRRLTYVSCHPAALARDLGELAAGYGVESLTLLDLFPQTGHLEVVAQLVAK